MKEKLWVDLWDEQMQDLVHIVFRRIVQVKQYKNIIVWSCVDFAEEPEKVKTIYATFKDDIHGKHDIIKFMPDNMMPRQL